MSIKISSSVPIPNTAKERKKRQRHSERQEAVEKLEVNQSFFLKTSINSVSTLIWWANARFPERHFVTEKENAGVRIWRKK